MHRLKIGAATDGLALLAAGLFEQNRKHATGAFFAEGAALLDQERLQDLQPLRLHVFGDLPRRGRRRRAGPRAVFEREGLREGHTPHQRQRRLEVGIGLAGKADNDIGGQSKIRPNGADAFDHTRFVATTGYVYDQGAAIGEIVLGSPHARLLDFRFHGTAAHAGMHPEDGRSAIAAAAQAIADFRLGRVDDETSANVGVITGGTARNVVPEWCSFTAEVRSQDERKAIELAREMVESAAFAASLVDCEVESEVRPSFPGYRFRESDAPVRIAAEALARAGYTPTYALSGGGADANVFNARGLQCVNLANGMTDIHTPDERISVADLEGMVEVTLALIDVARETK